MSLISHDCVLSWNKGVECYKPVSGGNVLWSVNINDPDLYCNHITSPCLFICRTYMHRGCSLVLGFITTVPCREEKEWHYGQDVCLNIPPKGSHAHDS